MSRSENQLDTRDLALKILLDMERSGRMSSGALEDGLRPVQFSAKEERAFVTRLVEGVTEYRLQLDGILNSYAKKPVEKQKPLVRTVLRLSVYQLLYMDSVPDRAVLAEAGRLLRKHHMDGMTGVVNGILRNVQRGIVDDSVERLIRGSMSITWSVPEELAEKLCQVYGTETAEKILQAGFTDRPLTIRVNKAKTNREELEKRLMEAGLYVEEGSISPSALKVSGVDFVRKLPGFREGQFFVQDESSMAAVESLGELAGLRVLELCAAPGGKSTYAAELGGIVTARDISEEKTEKIRENTERLGISMEIEEWDATVPREEDREAYDVVIADVPCSGLGVMGRKNDIKYHYSDEGVKELAELGEKILDSAAAAVKPGGRLLFSTCTILPEENIEQVQHFTDRHPDFTIINEKQFLQGVDPCDGFYFCLMGRRDSSSPVPELSGSSK